MSKRECLKTIQITLNNTSSVEDVRNGHSRVNSKVNWDYVIEIPDPT